MSAAWAWLKEHALALVAGIATLLGALLLYKRHRDELRSVRDALAVEKARRDVSTLTAKRDVILQTTHAQDAKVVELDQRIADNKRLVVETRNRVQDLTDEEIADSFRRLGY